LTASAGFKRLGFVLLGVLAVAAGVLVAGSFLLSADTIRRQALNEIRAVTGLNPVLRGEASVSLFPSGSISFNDVVLGEAKQPALTAERLTARLRFFPLLLGRVEIADVSLERPYIVIDIEPNGQSNWSGLIEALARSQNSGSGRIAAFSEMRIDGGTIVVRKGGRTIEALSGIELSLAWPSISKSFGATGKFVWHDEPVTASLALTDFPAALAGNRSGVKLRLAGAPLKAAFEGAVIAKPSLKVEGTLAADAPSLREALIWSGQKPLPGGGFGHFTIKAQTSVMAGNISLSGVNVELDGNAAEGVLTFATDGRQTLQGTLAADTLDLTPYISTVRLLAGNQRQWNSGAIALDGLSGIDFDLRLSAANVIISNAKIGRTAIVTNLRGGQLVITVGEAQAYGGVIRGALALADFDKGVEVKSQMLFSEVDLESCLGQVFGLRRLEGKGTIAVSVEGTGESVLAVTRTLNGNATVNGTDGALAGLNVEQLLRRLERRPLSGGGEFRTGRTPYDKLSVAVKITQGMANVEQMTIEGSAVRLALGGTASIPERELDLKGTAALVTTGKAGAPPFELPFIVQGSWDDPIMLPDPEALIRRSGAAAPLLNAIRERSARDSVRSVIDRVIRTPAPAAAIPAADQAPSEPAKPQ